MFGGFGKEEEGTSLLGQWDWMESKRGRIGVAPRIYLSLGRST